MRFVPLLSASLLLHLAVILAVGCTCRREIAERHAAPYLVVEQVTSATGKESRSAAPAPRPAPPPAPKQARARVAETAPAPVPAQTPPARNAVEQSASLPMGVPPSPTAASAEMSVSGAVGVTPKGGSTGAGSAAVAGQHGGGAGASPGVANSSAAATGASLQRRGAYQALLKRLIEAHKEYPLAARRSGREGNCLRRFVISRSGALKQVDALSSCGHEFLDDAATRAITAVGTFPPLPDEFKGGEATFTVTIAFTLARK